jgi:hypothetical protein
MPVKVLQKCPQVRLVLKRPEPCNDQGTFASRKIRGSKVMVEPVPQARAQCSARALALCHRHRLSQLAQARTQLVCVIL